MIFDTKGTDKNIEGAIDFQRAVKAPQSNQWIMDNGYPLTTFNGSVEIQRYLSLSGVNIYSMGKNLRLRYASSQNPTSSGQDSENSEKGSNIEDTTGSHIHDIQKPSASENSSKNTGKHDSSKFSMADKHQSLSLKPRKKIRSDSSTTVNTNSSMASTKKAGNKNDNKKVNKFNKREREDDSDDSDSDSEVSDIFMAQIVIDLYDQRIEIHHSNIVIVYMISY